MATSGSHVYIEAPRFDRPEVEVHVSTRRTKTGAAHWSGSRIVVSIPARLRVKDRTPFVNELVDQLLTQRPHLATGDASLEERAKTLAELYVDGVSFHSVRWVGNQKSRWASCSPDTKEIRVSKRLRQCPEWVIDAVLVHELAHLLIADHSPAFYDIADRHPRQAESATFLEGYALGLGLSADGLID